MPSPQLPKTLTNRAFHGKNGGRHQRIKKTCPDRRTDQGADVFVVATDIGLLFLALRALGAQIRSRQALTTALELQKLVSQEVDHRLKNLMATINGLISMLQKHASTPKELGDQLRQRIDALSHSIALLRGAVEGERISLRKAIESALEPLGLSESDRLTIEGPDRTSPSTG
jgi:two-component sensor histidine kinase